jgi:hypothetical protein
VAAICEQEISTSAALAYNPGNVSPALQRIRKFLPNLIAQGLHIGGSVQTKIVAKETGR